MSKKGVYIVFNSSFEGIVHFLSLILCRIIIWIILNRNVEVYSKIFGELILW